jgi:hypothetical protein
MESKVSKEIATEEVYAWLDLKKIGAQKRETQKDQINTLIDAVVDGSLSLTSDKVFVLELKFPTEGETPLKKLEFKPRLQMALINQHLQGVKPTDFDGRIAAYAAALTTQTKTLLSKLDTEDYGLVQSIVLFFM